MTDFDKKSFDGVSQGLSELSEGVKEIPVAMEHCVLNKDDLSIIYKMIEVFANPFSLAYTVGKNILVNGVDIFHKIEDATTAFNKADYYNFGRYCGEAMDEVFFHSNETQAQV